MPDKRNDGMYLLMLGCIVLVTLGSVLGLTMEWSMTDFKFFFYAAKCLRLHSDPYDQQNLILAIRREGIDRISESHPTASSEMMTHNVYPPSQFLITFPLGWMSFGTARLAWMAGNLGSLILGSVLIWKMGAKYSSAVSGALVGFVLANSETTIALGNAAGITVGLCLVATWCFLNDRQPWPGVICFAASLMLKPQIAALIWVFFLLLGGTYRRRAVQSGGLAIGLSLLSSLWITSITRHWPAEWAATIKLFNSQGGINDPGPSSALWPTAMVNLQTVTSLFDNRPSHYNLLAYLLCGVIVIPLGIAIIKMEPSRDKVLIGLAAVAALSLLILYHRRNDAKLLLLSVPACTLLVSEGGVVGRMALGVTSAALFFTGDNPWIVGFEVLKRLGIHHALLAAQLQAPIQVLPGPLSLLITGAFYVWVFVRRDGAQGDQAIQSQRSRHDARLRSTPE